MIRIEPLIKNLNKKDFDDLHKMLLKLLELNYRENLSTKDDVLINVSGFRGIGKTTALIKFAESNDFTVIEPNEMTADILRKRDGYKRVFSPTLIKNDREGWNNCVIDEGVDIKKLREKYEHINIVAGYHLEKEEKKQSNDLANNTINSLNYDIESLLEKLKLSIKDNKFSDYKMLINNLRETIDTKYRIMQMEGINIKTH